MEAPPIRSPRRVLALWSAALVAATAAGVAFNVWLGGYADALRERNPQTYIAQASILVGRGDLSGAAGEIKKALRLDPRSPEAMAVLGHIHYRQKQWEAALAAYQKAMREGSNAVDVRQHTVWALIQLNRNEEAARFGANAIAGGFKSPVLPRYVAEAYFRSQKFAECIPYFQKALDSYPDDQHLMDKLRQAYMHTGQNELANRVQARITEVEATRDLLHPEDAGDL